MSSVWAQTYHLLQIRSRLFDTKNFDKIQWQSATLRLELSALENCGLDSLTNNSLYSQRIMSMQRICLSGWRQPLDFIKKMLCHYRRLALHLKLCSELYKIFIIPTVFCISIHIFFCFYFDEKPHLYSMYIETYKKY